MHTGLFHHVRDRPELLSKVLVVPGDMILPGLGIDPATLERLQTEVTVVIHNAARCATVAHADVDITYSSIVLPWT